MTLRNLLFLVICGFSLVAGPALGYLGWQGWTQPRVQVDWTTATELSTIGFNLYRSEVAEGPFEQVNTDLIPASSDPLAGGSYSYVDVTVEPGKTYFYQLEDVDEAGMTSRSWTIEVKAERGGIAEIILAAAFLAVGLYGVWLVFGPQRGAAA